MKNKIGLTIQFELLYRFATTLIFIPLFQQGLLTVMHLAGYAYLTNKNLVSFLLNPIALVSLIGLFLFISAYSIIDIAGLLLIWNSQEKLNLNTVFLYALKQGKRVFQFKNWPILLWMLIFLPFLNVGLVSNAIYHIQIPPYIVEFMQNIPLLYGLLLALFGMLAYIMVRTLLVFPYFILDNQSFLRSFVLSSKHLRHHTLSTFFIFVGIQIFYSLLSYGLISGIAFLLFAWNLPMKWFVFTLVVIFFNSMMLPINYITISKLYQKNGAKDVLVPLHPQTKIQSVLYAGLVFVFLLIYGLDTYVLVQDPIQVDTQISAHRGASDLYPENTLAAFIGAKELGADSIELDVQQTKDGVLVVSHDSNLKRTAGIDLEIYEADYAEIKEVDVGDGEKLPTLQEAIELAKKEKIHLIIELKETGHEHDLVQDTVALIEQEDFVQDCMLTSFDYHLLEEAKAIDPSIQTLALFTFAYGNLSSFKDADAFSVEESTITPELVSSIHKEGKQLYAWTPNTKSSIDRLLSLGVDGLITNTIEEAKQEVKKKEANPIYRSLPALF